MDTYYSILGVNQDATEEEIKLKYQELIKVYHPDKQKLSTSEEFIKVNKAWIILRDPKTRKEYDSKLLQNDLKENSLIYAELTMEDIQFVNGIYNHPCRCGDHFVICKKEIYEDSVIECAECSNCILITLQR